MSGPELKPCPFCGGEAVRQTLPSDEFGNDGGDVIECEKCLASSHVEFGRKENLVSAWNTRDPAVIAALPEVQALIAGVLGQAASMIEDNVRHAAELGREIWPIPDLRTLTPADAIAARDAMIAEAVAKEREACAELAASSTVPSQTAMRLSAAIRKRGNV